MVQVDAPLNTAVPEAIVAPKVRVPPGPLATSMGLVTVTALAANSDVSSEAKPSVTAALPRARFWPTATVPSVTVKPPLNELLPDKFSVPLPNLTIDCVPELEIAPDRVNESVAASVVTSSPLARLMGVAIVSLPA